MKPTVVTTSVVLLAAALCGGALSPVWAQPSAALADRLPAGLRPAGQAIVEQKDPKLRGAALTKLLADAPGTGETERLAQVTPFIAGLIDAAECPEVSPAFTSRSSSCFAFIARALRRSVDATLLAQVERWAASHPHPRLAVEALERLAEYRKEQTTGLLRKRIAIARAAKDTDALLALGRTQEALGSQLPAFLWNAPARFEARPAGPSLRVVAIGDSGTGGSIQESCATTIARLHRQQPFDFGITLGDNYQDDGPHGPADARWQTYWERFYPQLGIPFYVSLGNHDWNNPAGPAAGLLYQNPSWKLPALYYTYTAGPVQFFVLNTVLLSERQRLWLERELQASTARWKVVYGHYQIYSALRGDHATLVEDILPILEANDADLYLCGHEHLFQHIKPKGRVHLFVNGAAGAGARAAEKKNYANVLFMAERRQGFSILEASEGSLSVKFIDEKGAEIYHHTLRK